MLYSKLCKLKANIANIANIANKANIDSCVISSRSWIHSEGGNLRSGGRASNGVDEDSNARRMEEVRLSGAAAKRATPERPAASALSASSHTREGRGGCGVGGTGGGADDADNGNYGAA